MNIQAPEQKRWLQQRMEPRGNQLAARSRDAHPHSAQSDRGRGVRAVPAFALRRPEALLAGRRARRPSRFSTRLLERAAERRRAGDRHRHGAPRPPERSGEHRRQSRQADLLRVRRRHRPIEHAGLGRREVSPRRDAACGTTRQRARDHRLGGAQSEPSRSVDPVVEGIVRPEAGPPRRHRARARHPAPDPRRRGLRRTGRGGRDAEPVAARRLYDRRHDPPRSSTTRSASRRCRTSRARRRTPPTSRAACRRPSST